MTTQDTNSRSTDSRKYDDELFQGTAHWYETYRPRYVPDLYKHLSAQFHLEDDAQILDLGCGTGFLARGLAPHVGHVFALDPDSEMLDEARKAASSECLDNITWIQGEAETLPSKIDNLSLTTIGTAFHWMHQEKVLNDLYGRTHPGGGVAIITNRWNYWKDNSKEHTIPWKKRRIELVQRFLGDMRRAGKGIAHLDTGELFESVLMRSPFSRFQTWEVSFEHVWTVDTLLGLLYSTSFGRRSYFGDKLAEFEGVFRNEMLEVEPSGTFVDTITTNALLAWK